VAVLRARDDAVVNSDRLLAVQQVRQPGFTQVDLAFDPAILRECHEIDAVLPGVA
jgi:hypothetical protein